ncbi:MAG: hypothetical protein ABSF15_04860 [Candidatus Sulfotelmatobacter sp.]
MKKTNDVPNVLGDCSPPAPVVSTTVFPINGQVGKLTTVGGDPAKGLFFVFNDRTGKTDT